MLYSAGRFEFFSEIANRKTFSNLQSECFFSKKPISNHEVSCIIYCNKQHA